MNLLYLNTAAPAYNLLSPEVECLCQLKYSLFPLKASRKEERKKSSKIERVHDLVVTSTSTGSHP